MLIYLMKKKRMKINTKKYINNNNNNFSLYYLYVYPNFKIKIK